MVDNTKIEFYRGDAYSKEITITDNENDNAIDLTGYTLTMFVDKELTPDSPSTTELFQLVGNLTDPLNGKVTFTPTKSNNDITEDTYHYRVKMALGITLRPVKRDDYKII